MGMLPGYMGDTEDNELYDEYGRRKLNGPSLGTSRFTSGAASGSGYKKPFMGPALGSGGGYGRQSASGRGHKQSFMGPSLGSSSGSGYPRRTGSRFPSY